VVVAGVHVLSPGQKVTVYKDKAAVAQVKPATPAMNSVASTATTASAPAGK
jgi:multidrug efflux system membrane fusion protein